MEGQKTTKGLRSYMCIETETAKDACDVMKELGLSSSLFICQLTESDQLTT